MIGTVLLAIIKIIGTILLVLLAVLLVALFLPFHAAIRYEQEIFAVDAGLFFFNVNVIPGRPKPEKPKKEKKEKKAEKKESGGKKAARRRKPEITLAFIQDMLDSLGWVIKCVLRGVAVKDVRFCWPVHEDDAASTAIQYGRMLAACSGVQASLQNILRLRVDEFRVLPDFDGNMQTEKHFACKITAQLYIIIVIAIYALIFVLPKLRKARVI